MSKRFSGEKPRGNPKPQNLHAMHPARAELIHHGLILNATPEERRLAHQILSEEAQRVGDQPPKFWSNHWLEKEVYWARAYSGDRALITQYVKAGETQTHQLKRLAACAHNEGFSKHPRLPELETLIELTTNLLERDLPKTVVVEEALNHLTIAFNQIISRVELASKIANVKKTLNLIAEKKKEFKR